MVLVPLSAAGPRAVVASAPPLPIAAVALALAASLALGRDRVFDIERARRRMVLEVVAFVVVDIAKSVGPTGQW